MPIEEALNVRNTEIAKLRALGVSEEIQQTYYRHLPFGSCDRPREDAVFLEATDALGLSEADLSFVRRMLAMDDPR